jgi:hypothetical protein
MTTTPSNMVAAHNGSTEKLRKISSSKEDWIKVDKNYFLTKAGAYPYFCSDHLLGLAKKPEMPDDISELKSSTIKYINEEIEKYNKLDKVSWGFMYDILDGSPFESLIDIYMGQPQSSKLAWDAVNKHFEEQSQAQVQQAYESKIDNLTVSDSGDLKTDFDRVVDELNKYCNILASQPKPYRVKLNDTSKKLKLQRALAKSPRFKHITSQGSTVTDDYTEYIDAIKKLITNMQTNEALGGATTTLDNKLTQAKNETSTNSALLISDKVDYDQLLKDAKPEEINALKTSLKANWNKFTRATNKFNKANGSKRDTDTRDQQTGSNKRPHVDNRQQQERGGGGGGRNNGRSNYQGRANNSYQYNYNRNNNYQYQPRTDYQAGGRGGRGGGRQGGRFDGRGGRGRGRGRGDYHQNGYHYNQQGHDQYNAHPYNANYHQQYNNNQFQQQAHYVQAVPQLMPPHMAAQPIQANYGAALPMMPPIPNGPAPQYRRY